MFVNFCVAPCDCFSKVTVIWVFGKSLFMCVYSLYIIYTAHITRKALLRTLYGINEKEEGEEEKPSTHVFLVKRTRTDVQPCGMVEALTTLGVTSG